MAPLTHYKFIVEVIHKDIEDGCSPPVATQFTSLVSSRKRLKHILNAQVKKFSAVYPNFRSLEVRVQESWSVV